MSIAQRGRRSLTALVCLGLMFSMVRGAQAQDETQDSAAAESQKERLKQLEERVRQLEQLRLSQPPETPESKRLRTVYDDGFYLVGADDQLKIGGWAQADFRALEGRHPSNNEFMVRRARLDVRGVLEHDFTWRLYGSLEGSSARLVETWLEYRKYPSLRVRVGQFKEPFSLEAVYSARWTDFVERSLAATHLAPYEDIGLQVFGTLLGQRAEYAVSMFNGSGRNATELNDDKDVAARLTFQPFRKGGGTWLGGLYVGGSATRGQSESDLAGQVFRTAPRTPFVTFAPGTTHDGTYRRLGAELEWLVGPAGITFEHLVARRDNLMQGAARQDIDVQAWYVSLTYLLTGEQPRRNAPVVPKANFDPAAGWWGAWELGARYEEFKTDAGAFTSGFATGTDRLRAVTGGLTWWPNYHVRAMLNVVFSDFDDAIAVDGQSLQDELAMLTRFQFNF